MSRRSLIRLLTVFLVVGAFVGIASAGMYWRLEAASWRLTNYDASAVVTVWVRNPACGNQSGLVTVVGVQKDGTLVQSQYPIWVAPRTTKPIDIAFGSQLSYVRYVIVTRLAPPPRQM